MTFRQSLGCLIKYTAAGFGLISVIAKATRTCMCKIDTNEVPLEGKFLVLLPTYYTYYDDTEVNGRGWAVG